MTEGSRTGGENPGILASSPSQTVGPFFHDALIRAGGSRLVESGTRGERIRVVGRVLDGDGEPVDDAMVEIWQPDAAGVFPHPADPRHGEADPAFSGFGRADTADGGRFAFETVRPGRFPGTEGVALAPFISVRVFSRGLLRDLVTRAYLSDEATDDDPVLSSVPAERRATLIAEREADPGPGGGATPTFRFDIRLQGPDETVFFEV